MWTMARATAIVFLLLSFSACLWLAAGTDAECRAVNLMTLQNHSDGIHISILSNSHQQASQPRSSVILESKTISQRYLSSECGSHYFRCDDLLVVTTGSNNSTTQHIALVPLVDGILLVRLQHNGSHLTFAGYHIVEVSTGCSPTKILRITDGVYFICLNLEARYLSVLQLYLDTNSLKNTRISSPFLKFSILDNPSTVSNFQFISFGSDPNSQLIYFSSGRYLYALTPLSYSYSESGEFQECTFAESLAYAGDWTLIAYCYNRSVYFSLAYEQQINQTFYFEHGRPFVCPNPNVHLSVFSSASYIQYGLRSNNSRENINVPGMNFDSGICFGKHNGGTLFVYYDIERGVYVLDPATAALTPLTSKGCFQNSCEPLKIFENRYVVIREVEANDANVIVIDMWKNFSKIIEGEHVPADLLTLISDNQSCVKQVVTTVESGTDATQMTTVENSGSQKSRSTPVLEIALSTVSVAVTLLIVILILIITVIVLKRRRKFCFSSPKSAVRESGENQSNDTQVLIVNPTTASGPPEYIKVLKLNNIDIPRDHTLSPCKHVYEDKPIHTEETVAELEQNEGELTSSKEAPQTDQELPQNQPHGGCPPESTPSNSDGNQSSEAHSNHTGISVSQVQNMPHSTRAHEEIELDTLPSTPGPQNIQIDTGAITYATSRDEREQNGYCMSVSQESDSTNDLEDTDCLLAATSKE